MKEFKKVKLADKIWTDKYIKLENSQGSHKNFTNLFIWEGLFNYRLGEIENYLLVKSKPNGEALRYFFPCGEGELRSAVDYLRADALKENTKLLLVGLTSEQADTLHNLYPGEFSFSEYRDYFEYVYSLEKMATLAGRKLSAKRNHINSFKKNYSWSIEAISQTNLGECWEMNKEWCISNGCVEDFELAQEYCAVKRAFDNFGELGLEGILLRVNDKIVAFTVGEILNSNTYVIHFEKAFTEYRGAYPLINQEFAKIIQEKYPYLKYVNREDDMGKEGLRKSKESYYPEIMVEKITALEK